MRDKRQWPLPPRCRAAPRRADAGRDHRRRTTARWAASESLSRQRIVAGRKTRSSRHRRGLRQGVLGIGRPDPRNLNRAKKRSPAVLRASSHARGPPSGEQQLPNTTPNCSSRQAQRCRCAEVRHRCADRVPGERSRRRVASRRRLWSKSADRGGASAQCALALRRIWWPRPRQR